MINTWVFMIGSCQPLCSLSLLQWLCRDWRNSILIRSRWVNFSFFVMLDENLLSFQCNSHKNSVIILRGKLTKRYWTLPIPLLVSNSKESILIIIQQILKTDYVLYYVCLMTDNWCRLITLWLILLWESKSSYVSYHSANEDTF